MTVEDLRPTTELERAFVQARGWAALHSWRRGTHDLHSGRVGPATGIYLALARTQALEGKFAEAQATLDCLHGYDDSLSTKDKVAVVRVLCSIITELKEQRETLEGQQFENNLVQSAFTFVTQIRQKDKCALLAALTAIKHSTELDVIAQKAERTQVEELVFAIEKHKIELNQIVHGTDKNNVDEKIADILDKILDRAAPLKTNVEVVLTLLQLIAHLSEQSEVDVGKICSEVSAYASHLVQKRIQNLVGADYVDSDAFERPSDANLSSSGAPSDGTTGATNPGPNAIIADSIDATSDATNAASDTTGASSDATGASSDATGATSDPTGAALDMTGAISDTTGATSDATDQIAAKSDASDAASIVQKYRQKRIIVEGFIKNNWGRALNETGINRRNEDPKIKPAKMLGIETTNDDADSRLAILLNDVAEILYVKGHTSLACDFYTPAICEQVRLQQFGGKLIKQFNRILANGLINRDYSRSLNQIHIIRTTVELVSNKSLWRGLLDNYSNIFEDLFAQLCCPEINLDEESFSVLKTLTDSSTKFSGPAQDVDLRPYVLQLLHTRAERTAVPQILKYLWDSTYQTVPNNRTFSNYIQPLAIMTEQLLGSSTPTAFNYHSRINDYLKQNDFDKKTLIILWRVLIAVREEKDGRNSPSLLPLLACLAELYFTNDSTVHCLDVCERILQMDKSDLSGVNIGVINVPDYFEALLKTLKIYDKLDRKDQCRDLIIELSSIAMANKEHLETNQTILTRLNKYLNHFESSKILSQLFDLSELLQDASGDIEQKN